ncbi:MAG: RNA polymerase sigma factor [Gemmataceae bacterium]
MSLLQRARHQLPEAWERLLFLYGPLVEYWCRRWGAQDADVEDLRQEVFRSVASALPDFRRDRPGDTFRGWLRVITHRKFLDFCRRQQRTAEARGGSSAYWHLLQVPEQNEPPAGDDAPEQQVHLHQRALELVRGQFEPKTWQAFWRTAVDGHAPNEVGADLGMTAVAVRKAKSRVLRRLREEMGELLGLDQSG